MLGSLTSVGRRQLARAPVAAGFHTSAAACSSAAPSVHAQVGGAGGTYAKNDVPSPVLRALDAVGVHAPRAGGILEKPSVTIPTWTEIVAKFGLEDPKRSIPVGVLVALPLFSQNVIHFSHEFQLAGCFAIFVGAAYKAAAPHVNEYFANEQAEKIRAHNLVEDQRIAAFKEYKDVLQARKTLPEEVKMVYNYDVWVGKAVANALGLKAQYDTRDEFVALLEKQFAQEQAITRAIQSEIVGGALKYVQAQVSKEAAQKAALDLALQQLADPKAVGKKDIVADLYKQYFEEHKKRYQAALKGKSNLSEDDQLDLARKVTGELISGRA